MWTRLISGNGLRRTRLHNHDGRLIDARGLLYLPRSVLTALALKVTGRRPELPWIGFRAIERLEQLIRHDWRVLEFGSGMSTLWFARRCGRLVSVETNPGWHERVRRMLAERNLTNVDYRLRDKASAHVLDDCEDSSFDLVLVDGPRRDLAVLTAIRKVKPGGYVYLDNTDAPVRDNKVARAALLAAAGGPSRVRFFNDLTPARVSVTEGMLASMPGATGEGPPLWRGGAL